MKTLLNLGAVGLLTAALLDPLVCSMLGKPVPWWRDILMALGGTACIYLLVKFRKSL